MPIKDTALDDKIRMTALLSPHVKATKSLTGQGTESECNVTALRGCWEGGYARAGAQQQSLKDLWVSAGSCLHTLLQPAQAKSHLHDSF